MISFQKLFLVVLCFLVFQIFVQSGNAEPVFITKSEGMKKIIFDGKWTGNEWKTSGLVQLEKYDTVIRISHYEEFIYVFVDVIKDRTFDNMADRSIVCFDTENNKSKNPDSDDYCFIATLNSSNGITLQGDSFNPNKDYFKKIKNPEGLIAIGGISNDDDRYSPIPHTGYEFRIPIELLGRSDNYGFYVYVYDANKNTRITYPEIITEDYNNIPSPSQWGDLISPDKSIPEFEFFYSILLVTFIGLILIIKISNTKSFQLKSSLFKY